MSRRSLLIAVVTPCVLASVPLGAQDRQAGSASAPPLDLDISADIEADGDDGAFAGCKEDQDAAELTGEIIVCRKRTGDENRLYDKEQAERRHAEKTAYKGDPEAPDFILDCKEQGMPVGCFAMGGAPEKVYMIDFDSLPDTPIGSDADRTARGLAPRGTSANADGTVTIAGGSSPLVDEEQ